jgi:hypothetical protein
MIGSYVIREWSLRDPSYFAFSCFFCRLPPTRIIFACHIFFFRICLLWGIDLFDKEGRGTVAIKEMVVVSLRIISCCNEF